MSLVKMKSCFFIISCSYQRRKTFFFFFDKRNTKGHNYLHRDRRHCCRQLNKLTSVFSCFCPHVDDKLLHKIVKVALEITSRGLSHFTPTITQITSDMLFYMFNQQQATTLFIRG